ncbi:DUF167 domain-containing protein [Candidatus Woesearchaeota archaeon]|nr:MAG: DUF167 domain-containing protein [Candidatus Woesearchaeota archaeon]
MIFTVQVKPNSRTSGITFFDEQKRIIHVQLKEKAEDNKANIALVKLLSRHFKQQVKIKSGCSSKEKLVTIG